MRDSDEILEILQVTVILLALVTVLLSLFSEKLGDLATNFLPSILLIAMVIFLTLAMGAAIIEIVEEI